MEVIFDFGIGERERRWNKKTLNLEFSGFGRQPVSLSSPDKSVVITATQEYAIQVWNPRTKRISIIFEGHQGWISSLAISPDWKYLASGSYDKSVRFWNLQLMVMENKFLTNCYVYCVQFTSDLKYIVAGCSDGSIRVWGLKTDIETFVIKAHLSHVIALKLMDNDRKVLSIGNDSNGKVWKFPEFGVKLNFETSKLKVISVGFTKKARHVVIAFLDKKFKTYIIK